jgi:hypothetical protein
MDVILLPIIVFCGAWFGFYLLFEALSHIFADFIGNMRGD